MKKDSVNPARKTSGDSAILPKLEIALTRAVHHALERSPLLHRIASPSNGVDHGESVDAAPAISGRAELAPSHSEIATRAEALWREMGCPQGCDKQIWLAAERGLCRQLRLEKQENDRRALLEQLSLSNNVKMADVMEKLEELYPGQSGRETTSL